MKYTANYNLKKPDYTDPADIADINNNTDTIDTQLANKATKTKNYEIVSGGWRKDEDTGLIEEETFVLTSGINANTNLDVTITFPLAFPNQVFQPMICCYNNLQDPGTFVQYNVVSISKTNIVIRVKPLSYTNGVYINVRINGK